MQVAFRTGERGRPARLGRPALPAFPAERVLELRAEQSLPPHRPALPPMRARLALVDGDARPNEVELAPERPISIGRSRDNTVVLPREDQASRLHARVYFENGRWLLRDFGLNGTRINDSRVNQVAELADGSEIRIGTVRLQFLLSQAAKAGHGPKPSERPSSADTMSGAGARFGAEE